MSEADPPLPGADAEELRMTPEAEYRYDLAVRLGQIARYLTTSATRLRDTAQQVPLDELRTGAEGLLALVNVAEVAVENGPAAALAAYEALPYPSFLSESDGLEIDVYPDLPFYRGILAAEHIPAVKPPASKKALTMHIVSQHHIAVNGRVIELKGEVLYMFNALLLHRDRPTRLSEFEKYGFRQSPGASTTKIRANRAMRDLGRRLAGVVPKGFETILEFSKNRWMTRQLSPLLVIEDVRGNAEFAHLIPMSAERFNAIAEADISTGNGVEPSAQAKEPEQKVDVPPPAALPSENMRKNELAAPQMSTAQMVADSINANYGLEVTAAQVRDAAAEDPLIHPVYNDNQPTYSDYATRKIVRLLLASRQ